MNRTSATFLFAITVVLLYVFSHFFHNPNRQTSLPDKAVEKWIRDNFTVWNDCLTNRLKPFEGKPEELWSNLRESIAVCEQVDEIKSLPIRDFNNSDESKRHILPKLSSPSAIITLGIGHDTTAEEKLMKELAPGSEFFGADPIQEVNEDLFKRLPGKYFPFAVGRDSGLVASNVLARSPLAKSSSGFTYITETVVNIDIVYFLKNIVKKTFIDDIWIDAESAEYGIFGHFYRDGEFDKNGFTFCQFNMEMHTPNSEQKQLVHDFILRLLQDKRYAILRPIQTQHMRLYMLNLENEKCLKKYIV